MYKVLVWGMGLTAKSMIEFVLESDFKICGVTDSFASEPLENEFFMDIPVYIPEEWRDLECDYIAICAKDYFDEIKERIIELGIPSQKIYSDIELKQIIAEEKYSSVYATNDLWKYFVSNQHRLIHKWVDFFKVYERYFEKYRNTDVVICEVGVGGGGSLQMWKNYFGSKCTVIGIDNREICKQYEEERITVEIGSQSDPEFWAYIKKKYPKIDILIDDGGHTMEMQIVTFENMFGHIADGGVYLCEDTHTSYWDVYGGGYKKKDSYIEYTKNFIDDINAYYSTCDELQVSYNTRYIGGLHYYDSMVVIEKEKRISIPISIKKPRRKKLKID